MIRSSLCLAVVTLAFASIAHAARPQVSDDRELKELDLTQWDCRDKLGGSARTPDGVERNRLKNRSAPEGPLPAVEQTDSAGFLKRIAHFEALTKGMRRKDLTPEQRQLLDPLEKQMVTMTGYLSLAYCGPPETTNCGSGDFHDWHLEVFEKPLEHPPQPGDPTPIICEITPRTQNAIYRAGIRIQELTAFFRTADANYEATGHKAQKVRVTGYLLWDDEHNGAADVGTAIKTMAANKFHNPWRSVAWEIHPVIKIERVEGVDALATPNVPEPAPKTDSTTPAPVIPNSTPIPPPPAPELAKPAPALTATPPQLVTVLQPVRIKIPYGETTIPKGIQLRIISRAPGTVTVDYMGGVYPIPIASTDLKEGVGNP
jgi:hypothetical protein